MLQHGQESERFQGKYSTCTLRLPCMYSRTYTLCTHTVRLVAESWPIIGVIMVICDVETADLCIAQYPVVRTRTLYYTVRALDPCLPSVGAS